MRRSVQTSCKLAFLLLIFCISAVLIPFAFASGPYQLGSANTVTADSLVPRPPTKPCVVQLFSDAQFFDFNVENFSYAPPADCPGPWAKVVLEADINVAAGIQYDRTANFWLGPYNIYFGTTAEPSPTEAPSWHVESDLTDYSSIFTTAQTGQADIGNTLCCGLSSIIFASAQIEFYPLEKWQRAPVTANVVLPLSGGPNGGTVTLNTGADTLAGTFTMPTNIQNAYLDVYVQSQSDDEFWYTCVPNDVSTELESCGNTAFRETEITIDGQAAGVAPVFPWIFTGGIDPFLWFPLPGVQTLNFTPYRVNLTPFAGLLSNGQPHTVSLSVFNADGYFSATASLLLYLDPNTTQITGKITSDTLAAPAPVVTENLTTSSSGTITGKVGVTSNRNFVISGYIDTSWGRVETTVSQSVNFFNHQFFDISNTEFVQDITQGTTLTSWTRESKAGQPDAITYGSFDFPLTVDISYVVNSDGSSEQTTSATQKYQANVNAQAENHFPFFSSLSNSGKHIDTLQFDSSGNFTGNTGMSSSQHYTFYGSDGTAYNCSLAAANNVLRAIGPGCPH
jgi:hypothetical protein